MTHDNFLRHYPERMRSTGVLALDSENSHCATLRGHLSNS